MSDGPHLPKGFYLSALAVGIKASGKPDLAFAECAPGTSAAALFTTNQVVAAPLVMGKKHLKASGGKVGALIVNSGNANCATGPQGLSDCEAVCHSLSAQLKIPIQKIFPSSTGIIGVPLPAEKITSAIPRLVAAKEANRQAADKFAEAIMTTDTKQKTAMAGFHIGERPVIVFGVAKGAGMIHPNMATMLGYIFTDLEASPQALKRLLKEAADQSFNCISIDGDMSTNDTLLLLASGASGISLRSRGVEQAFKASLLLVCKALAEQIVSDGEGVTHVVRLHIEGARNRDQGRKIGEAIARSSLVKTAWAGSDPNWGRILAAIGSSSVRIDPAQVNIFLGTHEVCRNGTACIFNERLAHEYLSQPAYDIRIIVGKGKSKLQFLTCDLTCEYVRINADYST